MTREECEMKIKDLMIDIMETYNEYYPDGNYLSLHFRKYEDGKTCMSFSNMHWDEDKQYPIDAFWIE